MASWAMTIAPARVRVADGGRRAGALDEPGRRSSRSTPQLAPARGHPADPVVVGRGAPERERRRRREQRMDEAAVVVDLDRAVSGGRRVPTAALDRPPDRELQGADLEARPAPTPAPRPW